MRCCPECDSRTEDELCPRCGLRTILEREPGAGDPMLGRVLDRRYRIDLLLGRGGMGSVYRGTQLATGQVVAIKVIRADHAENTEAIKRFQREARAASRLTHPHTVRVFDFGQSETGDLYMVLEFLGGRTLGRLVADEGRLSEPRLLKIACEVAQSLVEAHAAGFVHRDLKPENVMLVDSVGDRDFVKVLDFGVAKLLSGSTGESSVTQAGVVVGTPQYMAPEQARATAGVSAKSDVYALGIILHECLTGRRPFDGDSALAILMAHASEPIPELPSDCPASSGLRDLLRRMLAKDPTRRPSSADVVAILESLRTGGTGEVRIPADSDAGEGATRASLPVLPATPNGTLVSPLGPPAVPPLVPPPGPLLTTPMHLDPVRGAGTPHGTRIDTPGIELSPVDVAPAAVAEPVVPATADVPAPAATADIAGTSIRTDVPARRGKGIAIVLIALVVVIGLAVLGLTVGGGAVATASDPVPDQVQVPVQVPVPVQVQVPAQVPATMSAPAPAPVPAPAPAPEPVPVPVPAPEPVPVPGPAPAVAPDPARTPPKPSPARPARTPAKRPAEPMDDLPDLRVGPGGR